MSVIYRPGTWTDVCVLSDGQFAQVTTDGATERVYFVNGLVDILVYVTVAPEPLMFCRCATVGHLVYSIHQGHDTGTAWLSTPDGWKDLGPTFGVQPVAIDSTYAYVVRSNQSYDRIRLSDRLSESFPHGVPGSSQGISDIKDGEIWWADLMRTHSYRGLTLTYPNRRGEVVVGQADPPQIAGIYDLALFTAFMGESYEPHIAWNGVLPGEGQGRYAIVARTPQGAAYYEGPPFDALVIAPAPPQKPAPQPVPPPTPETPVPFEQQMPNMLDVVKRVQREHPDEWAARADLRFINRLAWELSRIDMRFGLLGKRMTDTIAADSISFLNGTVDPQLPTNLSCEAADVIGSSHSDTPTPVWNPITKPVREGGAGAKWIPPTQPADVVQPAPTPTPTPTPTNPVPSPTAQTPGGLLDSMFASVLNRIAAQDEQITQLQRNNAILKARIDEQNDKIANLPSGGGGNVSIDGMRVAFKADNGKFLCADANKGGDVPVLANRDSAGGWETFTVVRR